MTVRPGGIRIDARPRPGQGRWAAGLFGAAAGNDDVLTALEVLGQLPQGAAIGAAVAFLLKTVDENPHVLQQVLMASVDKPGVRPVAIIDVLNRICGKG